MRLEAWVKVMVGIMQGSVRRVSHLASALHSGLKGHTASFHSLTFALLDWPIAIGLGVR